MFQTELTHFLQSFESDILTKILFIFTSLGNKEFFLFFVVVFMFSINFKKGLVLTHVLILTGLVTAILKNLFALPRPYHVDSNVKTLWDGIANSSPFTDKGATTFFGLPDSSVIDYYRLKHDTLFGIPSGHTSTAVTIWGSVYLFYKKNWLMIVSLILILIIPLSRLYLGRHFLADVLTGYVLGAILLFGFHYFYYKKRLRIFSSGSIRLSAKFFVHLAYMLLLPLLLFIFFPHIHTRLIGTLLGINFLLIYFSAKGFPQNHSKLFFRILASIVALIFYGTLTFIFSFLIKMFIVEILLIKFVTSGFISAVGLLASVKLCAGLKLLHLDYYSD